MRTDHEFPAVLGGVAGEVHGNVFTSVLLYRVGPVCKDPVDWVFAHRDELRAGVRTQGALLLRGLPVNVEAFQQTVQAVGGETLEYAERSTPRTEVSKGVYTSTDYPADQPIPMHNENSYSDRWPQTLFFFCQTTPGSGGATPLADSRAVLKLLPGDVRQRLAVGVIYVRNFREGLGLPWEDVFQTTEPKVVEDYCVAHGMEFEWTDEGLRTRHHRPATQLEPHTGAEVWFNQANLFHVSSLPATVREALLALYQESELPRNAYLGDGSPISDDDLSRISQAYQEASVALPWEPGDILLVNNMLMAHGRQPYTGDRRILVAMT